MKKRITAVMLALIMAVLCMPAEMTEVEAAGKPQKVKIVSVKSTAPEKLTVKWKKVSASGYQIQVAANKKFTVDKRTVKAGKKARKKTLSKLLGGGRRYVRVRAYRKAGKKIKYGKWSKIKSLTVRGETDSGNSGGNQDDSGYGTAVNTEPSLETEEDTGSDGGTGDNSGGADDSGQQTQKEKLSLSLSNNEPMIEGGTRTVSSNIRVKTWETSDSSIVRISRSYSYSVNVVGTEIGTVEITAVTEDGQTASCQVSVVDRVLGDNGTITLTECRHDPTIGRMEIERAINSNEGIVSIEYARLSDVDGYEAACAESESFTESYKTNNSPQIDIDKEYLASSTFYYLAQGVRYYVKVRPYKLDGTTKVCGEWSEAVPVDVTVRTRPSGETAKYNYSFHVLNPKTLYDGHGIVLYIRTDNPDPQSIGLVCDGKDITEQRMFATLDGRSEYTYADVRYKTDSDKRDWIRAVEGGYITTVEFAEPGRKEVRLREFGMKGYTEPETFSLDVRNYDNDLDAWMDKVIEESTDDTMNVHEKMTAICDYLLERFRYVMIVDWPESTDGIYWMPVPSVMETHTACFDMYVCMGFGYIAECSHENRKEDRV